MVLTTTGETRPSKTVLVTGGAGFIGSHTCQVLLARGDDVVIVDEMNSYYDLAQKQGNLDLLLDTYGADRVKVYKGDICDAAFMEAMFEAEGIEVRAWCGDKRCVCGGDVWYVCGSAVA